jgi:hypothetical protein
MRRWSSIDLWRALPLALLFSSLSAISAGAQQLKPCPQTSEKDAAKIARAAAAKGNWPQAEEYYICALGKKAKPEYQKELKAVQEKLADIGARQAEIALDAGNFKLSSQRLDEIAKYPSTAAAANAKARYEAAVDKIHKEFAAARKAAANEPEKAVQQMTALKRYADILPAIDTEIINVINTAIATFCSEAQKQIDQRDFDKASSLYLRVLAFDPQNRVATEGQAVIATAIKAFNASVAARSRYEKKQYEAAKISIDEALAIYPSAKDVFEPLRTDIIKDYVKSLREKIGEKPEEDTSFDKSLEHYLDLLKIRDLDPSNEETLALAKNVRKNLAQASAQKAKTEYWKDWKQAPSDPERIATAYLLMLNALLSGAEDIARGEYLTALERLFYRKRAPRLILSVENVAGADLSYVQRLENRCKYIIDHLQLQDLNFYIGNKYEELRNDLSIKENQPEVYQAAFDEDMKSIRPNDKSAYLLLKVAIEQYLKKEKQVVKEMAVDSSYVAETRKVPKQEYIDLKKKLEEAGRFFIDQKNRNKQFQDWTYFDYSNALTNYKDLTDADKLKDEEVVRNYKFNRVDYLQESAIKLNLKVVDALSKEEEVLPGEIFEPKRREDHEITNVREKDKGNTQEKRLLWPPASEDLQEVQSKIDAALDAKIPELVKSYLDRFYFSGERALKENRLDDAAEDFLCHWAFYRGRVDPEQSKVIVKTIMERIGFDLNTQGEDLKRELIKSRPIAR